MYPIANIKDNTFSDDLLSWYDEYGRKNLPWQKNKTAYRVWVSEIMLQQTQVATVIPYYKNFMVRFKTVKSLALAKEDEVMAYWTGLGYYSRARHLHKTAKIIYQQKNSRFPRTLEALLALPGIGKSTASAILSIVYNQPTPILDGNVKRVLARVFTIKGNFQKKEVEKKYWALAKMCMATKRCADYTQAIMDLGATLCTRTKVKCTSCPLKKRCIAYKENTVLDFPEKKIKKTLPIKSRCLLLIQNKKQEILLEKRKNNGIWGGLWSLPECDSANEAPHFCKKELEMTIQQKKIAPPFRHTFSHYHLDITVMHAYTASFKNHTSRQWFKKTALSQIGLPGPVVKIIKNLKTP